MEVDGVISPELLSAIERDGDMIWAATVKLNGEPDGEESGKENGERK
jgi:hypothetical protein